MNSRGQARRLVDALLVCWAVVIGLPIASAAQGFDPSELYGMDQILWARVSPDGQWLASTETDGVEQRLMLQRWDGGGRTQVYASRRRVEPLFWVDESTFVVRFGKKTVLTRVSATNDGGLEYQEHVVRAKGTMVHALPTQKNQLVWGLQLFGTSSIHQVSVEDLLAFDEKADLGAGRFGQRLAALECESASWVIMPSGAPLSAHCWTGESWETYHSPGPAERLRKIHTHSPEDEKGLLKPMGPGERPGTLMVTAYRNKETIGLHEYDPRTRQFGRAVFHDELANVDWLRFDLLTGEVLSVEWNDGSSRRFAYVESSHRRFESLLGSDDPPIDQIIVEASSVDRKRFVYWTASPTEPGAHYLRDVDRDETRLFGRKMRELDRGRLAPMVSFNVQSTDDLEIEALLTLPLKVPARGAPLLVMPHGGPLGVHDEQRFDPLIQYLASWGIAVLQANYRGSSGYGDSFESAGRKEWARGIEDDLDAAFENAVARPEIDGDRVCILGGSYGGFSAVTSALRHPHRFRCVVTINGVSDVPFMMWDGSDRASALNARRAFETLIGDLSKDRDHLLSISPTYNLEPLETPVLVLYGEWDTRVPPDHAHRLIVMLKLHGKEFEEAVVAEGGHSFSPSQWVKTYPVLRRFIEKHLDPAN